MFHLPEESSPRDSHSPKVNFYALASRVGLFRVFEKFTYSGILGEKLVTFLGRTYSIYCQGLMAIAESNKLRENKLLYTGFVFFNGPPLKKTKSKIMLEYPEWASPGPPQKVKVHGLGLP